MSPHSLSNFEIQNYYSNEPKVFIQEIFHLK